MVKSGEKGEDASTPTASGKNNFRQKDRNRVWDETLQRMKLGFRSLDLTVWHQEKREKPFTKAFSY